MFNFISILFSYKYFMQVIEILFILRYLWVMSLLRVRWQRSLLHQKVFWLWLANRRIDVYSSTEQMVWGMSEWANEWQFTREQHAVTEGHDQHEQYDSPFVAVPSPHKALEGVQRQSPIEYRHFVIVIHIDVFYNYYYVHQRCKLKNENTLF